MLAEGFGRLDDSRRDRRHVYQVAIVAEVEPESFESYLPYPSFLRQAAIGGSLLVAVAGVVGIYVALLAPNTDDWPYRANWVVGAGLVLVPTALAASPYFRTAARRMRSYPILFQAAVAGRIEEDLRAVSAQLTQRLLAAAGNNVPRAAIQGVMLNESNHLCLVVSKVHGLTLGSQLDCVSASGFQPLGTFNVVAVEGERCVASELRIVDPVWWGAAYEAARLGVLHAPGDTIAIVATLARKADDDGN